MKKIVLTGKAVVTGAGSLKYLETLQYKRTFIVTGGSSMIRNGVIDQVRAMLGGDGRETYLYSGVEKNPSIHQVQEGLSAMQIFKPDLVLAVGGGSAMDAAKAMLLFYEFPDINFENVRERMLAGTIPEERKTALICVPSTSGTGAEATTLAVITDPAKNLKVPIGALCLRPDIALLDGDLPMTMPKQVAAETGLDALTHAIEAYTNHNLDAFTMALCEGAIKGIIKWLPISCRDQSAESRQLVHDFQCMAGMAFANVGLGAVHGIAHAFGGQYNLSHGMTNAIVLPYIMKYNSQDEVAAARYAELSYLCHCNDILLEIRSMTAALSIPTSFQGLGISHSDYLRDFPVLLEHAMLAPTNANCVQISKETMAGLLDAVYYGENTKL